jgi:protein-glutamine gamma-glutamyltransferase
VKSRLALTLVLALGLVALVESTRSPLLGAVHFALLLILASVGERWELDRGRQLVAGVITGGVAFSVTVVAYEPHAGELREGFARASALFLLGAASRLAQRNVLGGRAGTVAIAFAGLLLAGQTRAHGTFAALGVAFLVASLVALRIDDAGSLPLSRQAPRRKRLGAVVVITAAILAGGFGVALKAAYALAKRSHERTLASWRPRTGFSDLFDIGSLDGMLDSGKVVMRIHGPPPDYLRGAVFDTYEFGRWVRSDEKEKRDVVRFDPPTEGSLPTVMEPVDDPGERTFAPLEFGHLATVPPQMNVDAFGILRPATKTRTREIRLDRGARELAVPSAPTWRDLAVPFRIRPKLLELVTAWTREDQSPAQRIDAIELRLLREFKYSRSFERPMQADPVMHFLTQDPRGHCEYFASALALLGRVANVPVRVVTGFRVAEESSFGGYRLVREKNAHAWVEVWIEGTGWVTRDATPPSGIPMDQPHQSGYWTALADYLDYSFSRTTAWLGERTLAQTSVAVIAGFGLLSWILFRGAKTERQGRAEHFDRAEPLALLPPLLKRLAQRGLSRGAAEPLERFADRVPDGDVRAILLRYSALRYGDLGSETELARDAGEWLARER